MAAAGAAAGSYGGGDRQEDAPGEPGHHLAALPPGHARRRARDRGHCCRGAWTSGGVGYIPQEYEALGVPYAERGACFEEGIETMRLLWANDEVFFNGQHYRLDNAAIHVRPVQQPHPPLWIGAKTQRGIRRAARLGDTWAISPQVPTDDRPSRVAIFANERVKLARPKSIEALDTELIPTMREYKSVVDPGTDRSWGT